MPTKETYDDHVIRLFLMAAAVWGVVGMSIGVFAAAQMAWPALNFDVSWLTFSRIRANHTFGVIFAFGGSALMGTCYYIVQRTGHVRLAFGKLAMFTFWGWQAGCVLAMATMPFGITQSKEYAEPEWFIDLADRRGLGVVRGGVLRHAGAAPHPPHLRVELVLRRADHRRGAAAHRQQPCAAGLADQVLPYLLGRRGCDGAVVVRP